MLKEKGTSSLVAKLGHCDGPWDHNDWVKEKARSWGWDCAILLLSAVRGGFAGLVSWSKEGVGGGNGAKLYYTWKKDVKKIILCFRLPDPTQQNRA